MKKLLFLPIAGIALLIAGGIATYITVTKSPDEPASVNNMTVEQAIEDAENFQPADSMACISVMTPALHIETGASYTFPSGCLPGGWIRDTATTIQIEEENDTSTAPDTPQQQDDATSTPIAPKEPVSSSPAPRQPPDSPLSAQEEAIAKARAYQPPKGTMCTTVMTPALHVETGARYTFGYGCLPPGWIATRGNEL